MKKYILIAIYIAVYVSVSSNGYSLTNVPLFTTVKSSEKGLGISVPSDAGLFENNRAAFQSIPKDNHLTFQVQSFPLSAKTSVDLEVTPFQILAPNATVCIGTEQGDKTIDHNEITFLRGHIKGDPNSFVYLAVFQNHTSGYIEYSNQSQKFERVVIAPTSIQKGKNSVMVVSQEQQTDLRVQCETESMPNYHSQVKKSFELLEEYKKKSEQPLNSQTLVSTLAVECNFDFYKMHNLNLTETVNYTLTVIGASSAIFERDANIIFQINYLRVWTIPDPYFGGNNRDIFQKFGNNWFNNMQHIRRSIAILISGSYLGGIADINKNCWTLTNNPNVTGTSLSGMEKNAVFPTNNFVGEINTLTHELGHNLGAPHTHSCEWAPPIDSCYTAEGNCFAGIKGNTGTIMSYCYLNPLFTRLNFHPRVAGLMRTVAETSPCLAKNFNHIIVDLSLEQAVYPKSGSTIPINTEFIPSVLVKNLGKNPIDKGEIFCYISKKEEHHLTNYFYKSKHSLEPIGSGEVRTISFDPLLIEYENDYLLSFEIIAPIDSLSYNNILTHPFHVGYISNYEIQLDTFDNNRIFQVGEIFPISWKTTLFKDVRIDYSLDSGITWNPIISRISAQEKKYNWIIPAQSTTKGRIRISSFNESGISDYSSSLFQINVKSDVQPIGLIHPKYSDNRVFTTIFDTLLTTKVLLKNNSSTTATSVPVYLEIVHSPSGAVDFVDSVNIPEIISQYEDTVVFSTYRIPNGENFGIRYSIRVWTNLENDQNKENDTFGGGFVCRYYSTIRNAAIQLTPQNFGYAGYLPSFTWILPERIREEVLLEVDTSITFTNPFIQVVTKDTTYSIEELPDGHTFYWRVKRLTNGLWSTIWQFQKLNWICNPASGSCYAEVIAGSAEMARNLAKVLKVFPVVIRSKEESDWIQSTFGNKKTWLGYSNKADKVNWYWYTGEKTTYTNWAPNQPNNVYGNENYAIMLEDGTWADVGEYEEHRSIFEVKNSRTSVQNPKGGIVAELYPNPTSGEFAIQFAKPFETVTLKLVSIQGIEVYKRSYSNTVSIPVAGNNLANGTYTLVLQTEEGTFTTQIVILK